MYEEFFEHFGLQGNPFHVSPDPKRFYSTAAHDEALLQLVFGIESRQGFMVLTGEPGTGKTTIVHYLLDWLEPYNYPTAYVFHTLLPSMDLLQLILRDFGISCDSRNKKTVRKALKEWLMARHEAGDCPVIIIDEAQALTSRALDELRMLLKLENRGAKLLQLVLAGQPQLEEILQRRKLARLRQRIMCHCRLRPLTLGETSGYIASRLKGGRTETDESEIFPTEVVADIYHYSKGIPRVVNLFCEHALLAAYADRRHSISRRDVLRVARQFDLVDEGERAGEPPGGDTFSRLIPFPRLSAEADSTVMTCPDEVTERVAAETVAVTELLPIETLAASPEPVDDSCLRTMAAASPAVQREPELPASWSGAMRSFTGRCGAWLSTPVRKAKGPKVTSRNLVAAVYGWLRMPFGSTHMSGEAPRMPSPVHKHF
jgi:general secretion pathway protein A